MAGFHKAVIAIDMGTSQSGYATSIIHGAAPNFTFETSTFAAESVSKINETKSETILTIINDRDIVGPLTFLDAYDNGTPGHFARDFKMSLDLKTRGNVALKGTTVTLQNLQKGGATRTMPLMEVITRFLRVVGEMAFKRLDDKCKELGFRAPTIPDVIWVITVPAIWKDQARIFMREAFNATGLTPNDSAFNSNIRICLEPEGAALTSFHGYSGNKPGLVNKRVLNIDLGGGTADVTYHKILSYVPLGDLITLEEIDPPSGGPWGGRNINDKFEESTMKPLLGPFYETHYKANGGARYRFLQDQFEKIKKTFSTESLVSRALTFSELINEMGITKENININALNASKPAGLPDARFDRNRLFLPPEWFKYYFEASLQPLFGHLRTFVNRLDKPDLVFLVGGLGENIYVFSEVKRFFQGQGIDVRSIIQPEHAGISIVKGAIRFGFDSSTFALRRARTNYGIATYNAAIPWRNFFTKIVTKGEDLRALSARMERSPNINSPVEEAQTSVTFKLYECEENATHVDHPKCYFIAEVTVSVNRLIPFADRNYELRISMDDTVISCNIKEVSTGRKYKIDWTSR